MFRAGLTLFGIVRLPRAAWALRPMCTGVDTSVAQNLATLDVDHSMTIEERINWLKEVFGSMEPDADNRISVTQLDKLPTSLTSHVADVQALFDRDGDGRISLRHFSYGMTFLVQLASSTHHTSSWYNQLVYRLMDDDGNGVIDKNELLSWLNAADMLGLVKRSYKDKLGSALTREQLADAIFSDFASLRGRPDDITFDEFTKLSTDILDYSVFEKYTVKDLE